MGKLAHLHNNKCRFEPIESLLTFKWYKDVISKVCAYPGWLSAWMCSEWSNSHVSACALHSSVQHWQPCWQPFVIGEKMEVEKGGRGIEEHIDQDGLNGGGEWSLEQWVWWMLILFNAKRLKGKHKWKHDAENAKDISSLSTADAEQHESERGTLANQPSQALCFSVFSELPHSQHKYGVCVCVWWQQSKRFIFIFPSIQDNPVLLPTLILESLKKRWLDSLIFLSNRLLLWESRYLPRSEGCPLWKWLLAHL